MAFWESHPNGAVGAAQGVLLPWPTCSLKENPRPWGGRAEGAAEERHLGGARPAVSPQGTLLRVTILARLVVTVPFPFLLQRT